ncbi:hypothetical protein SAMN05444722_3339 [Rhodovulum sp. ES.010]|uniref:HEPN domain-containing protein n=1 Tax=Rhodovulum sp. ES.010 TaxID=1882821 RepID=UPI00092A2F9A|nr:HEPN domain-containing protein [Rhodovulum sp. ES.010]SIO54270.1 hypothetical protein SAMN05444722_3339 [Rhodovulum sp. ES.010]
MRHPTRSFKELKKSILKCKKVVARVPANDVKTDLHELKIRALILLAHSAIEEYLESLSREIAEAAVSDLQQNNSINAALLSLVTYHKPSLAEKFRASDRGAAFREALLFASRETLEKHKKLINDNNGIKQAHQNRLLFPIGVYIRDISAQLPDLLDSFAEKRGSVAHRIGIQKSYTRSDIEKDISQLLREIKELDKSCCKKHAECILDHIEGPQ